jgi:outer membrane protein assembly factor BamB
MKLLAPTDPTSVGPYRLTGVLGGGGMGRVYLGESATGRRLAIKVLRPELIDDPEYRERFTREIAAARLVSPMFTAAVIDADPLAESPWLATRFIDGPSLSQWVKDAGALPPRTVMTLGAGLAEALGSIHRVGLVHRDLKPSNVLIDDGGPHIIDFGIALLPDVTRLTASLMMGTPSYTAPERIRGEEATQASDVFALGATLYFAATARPLIAHGTPYQQVLQITAGQFDLSDLAPALRPLIGRCLSPRAQDRPTASEIVEMLLGAGIKPPTTGWRREPAGTAPVLRLPEPVRTSRRVFVISGVIGGLTLAGGIAWLTGLFRNPDETLSELPAGFGASLTPTGSVSASAARPAADAVWRVDVPTPARGATGGYALGSAAFVTADHDVISAHDNVVVAVNSRGEARWQTSLPNAVDVSVRPWRASILVSDPNSLWLLDDRGKLTWRYDAAQREKISHGADNPDNIDVRIQAIVAGVAHVFVNVGTALVAIDTHGDLAWRNKRTTRSLADLASLPIAADSRYLVARDGRPPDSRVSLYNVANGDTDWSVHDPYGHGPGDGGPDGRPGGGPGGGPSGGPSGSPPPERPPSVDDAWYRLQARIGKPFIVVRDNQEVTVRRLTTGAEVKHYPGRNPVADIAVVDSQLLISTGELGAYDEDTGTALWQLELPGARTILVGSDLYAVTSHTVARIEKGRITRQAAVPADLATLIPIRVSADDVALYATFADAAAGTCTVAAFHHGG